jgi:hypothetical protein
MTQTASTLTLLAAIGQLAHRGEFAPLTRSDRAAFCEAAADAQIAHTGHDVGAALCEVTGKSILIEGNAIIVIVSGQSVEVHAHTPEFEDVTVTIDLEVEC